MSSKDLVENLQFRFRYPRFINPMFTRVEIRNGSGKLIDIADEHTFLSLCKDDAKESKKRTHDEMDVDEKK